MNGRMGAGADSPKHEPSAVAPPEAPSGLPATIEGYRLLARALPETIGFMTDRALRFVLADGPALDTLPFSSAELEGQDARAYLRPAGRLDLLAAYEAALAGQESTGEAELTAGRTFTIRFCPLPEDEGVIPGVLAVAREVTREREAAAALAEREACRSSSRSRSCATAPGSPSTSSPRSRTSPSASRSSSGYGTWPTPTR